jgi:hypothetical protein
VSRAREVLQIAVRDSAHNEVVEVRTDELPDDAAAIVGVLRNERAPLSLWLAFGVEYYRRGNVDAFLALLRAAIEQGATYAQTAQQQAHAADFDERTMKAGEENTFFLPFLLSSSFSLQRS